MSVTNKKLGFGFMRLPVTVPGDETAVDMELVKKLVDLYMSRGFNYFDTARRYCGEMSEPALRECLSSRYPRESYELTDKITIFHG